MVGSMGEWNYIERQWKIKIGQEFLGREAMAELEELCVADGYLTYCEYR